MFGTGKKFNFNNGHAESIHVHLRPMHTPTKMQITNIQNKSNNTSDGKQLTKINSGPFQSKNDNSEIETINIGRISEDKPDISNKPSSSSSSSSVTTTTSAVVATQPGKIDATCICTRKSKTIFCAACHKFSFGRIKLPCPVHFNVLFLFDFSHCHHCQAGWYMMKEIDIEYSKIMEIESVKQKAITDAKEATTERAKKY